MASSYQHSIASPGPVPPQVLAQHPANWLYRLGFFTLIGAASGAAARALTRQLERLRATEARFGSVVENAADMILVHTPDGTVGYASPSTRRVLGHAPEELVGADLRDLIHPSDLGALLGAPDADACKPGDARTPTLLELRARHSDGAWRHLEATVTDLRADPSIMGILLVGRDVTERRTMEAQLLHQALHDPLTGLANKNLPADSLKIDRSFVRDIGAQDDDPVVTAVIGLAHRLGLGTVAEGVETTGQAERLTAWGCQQAQGYLFARPQEAETVQGLLGRELLIGSAVT